MTDFKVVKPNNVVRQDADKIYSKTFMKLWESGEAVPRVKIEQLLKKEGLLDMDAISDQIRSLGQSLKVMEIALRKAKNPDGTKMSKEQGRELALKMRKLRQEIEDITSSTNQYFNVSAETLASFEKMMYMTYACTLKEDGTMYWPTFQDCKDDDEVAFKAMAELLKIASGNEASETKWNYEDSWLIKFGFMNKDYQFIDTKGRLVTEDGKLINKDGYFINEQGQRIDYFGNRLDENGDLMVEDGWSDEVAAPPVPSVSSGSAD